MNDGFHRRSYSCFHRCFGLYFFNCFFLSTEDFEWPHLNGASDDNALVICRGIQSHVMQGFPLTASITQLIFTTSNVKKNQFLFFDQTFFFFSFVTFLMTGPLWAPVILKIFFWTVRETCKSLQEIAHCVNGTCKPVGILIIPIQLFSKPLQFLRQMLHHEVVIFK